MDKQPIQDKVITVLLADDHPITRAGIRATLSEAPDILIVGEAESGFDVEKMVAELQPRVLLLDLQMPGPRPADLECWVRQNYPETETLVLTAHGRDPYLATMMDAGVSGFLSKKEAEKNLVAAIRRTANGEIVFTSEQLQRIRDWRSNAGKKWAGLSSREQEIILLIARGFGNSAVAEKLGITAKTISFHLSNIIKKLEVTSRCDAIVWVKTYAPADLGEIP